MAEKDFLLQSAAVEDTLRQWSRYKLELSEHFKDRNSEKALPLMEKALELFGKFLFLSNGLDPDSHTIEDCSIKPVNVKERLDFISSRPKLFHSYIQLAELFAEQQKQYASKIALIKAKNKRPD